MTEKLVPASKYWDRETWTGEFMLARESDKSPCRIELEAPSLEDLFQRLSARLIGYSLITVARLRCKIDVRYGMESANKVLAEWLIARNAKKTRVISPTELGVKE